MTLVLTANTNPGTANKHIELRMAEIERWAVLA